MGCKNAIFARIIAQFSLILANVLTCLTVGPGLEPNLNSSKLSSYLEERLFKIISFILGLKPVFITIEFGIVLLAIKSAK